ncbi:MAG: dipeptide/oligopeptide/nickel ABC transporter ATP-binding protein [Desulfotomaculaceae bacterium]|nr:dipeptide/oligopeptide/nickel ABC transporter ATP-binding protein [Desulfotomaculaceae bacterium]
MSAQSLLSADDLSFSYPGSAHRVFENINLSLCDGEILGILGESGSGKTSLSLVLAGFERPVSGLILYKSVSIAQRKTYRYYRRSIQYLFQNTRSSVNRYKNIFDIVAEPLIYRGFHKGAREALVAGALKLVGLEYGRWYDYPDQFSLGQLQRICLARAITTRPQLIICDEPFSALDVPSRIRMEQIIVELNKKNGIAFIIISHEPRTLLKLCHKIMVLREGRQTDFWYADQEQSLDDYTIKLLSLENIRGE